MSYKVRKGNRKGIKGSYKAENGALRTEREAEDLE